MFVTTASIDGIEDCEGHPLILEFNRGVDSGSSGYRALTGRSMFQHVVSDLKRAGGFDQVWIAGTDCVDVAFHFPFMRDRWLPYQHKDVVDDSGGMFGCEDEDAEFARKYTVRSALLKPGSKHLVFPGAAFHLGGRPNLWHRYGARFFSNSPCTSYSSALNVAAAAHFESDGRASVTVADCPESFDAFYSSKVSIPKLIEQGVLNPSCYPYQAAYDLRGDLSSIASDITERFHDKPLLVFKAASLCRGAGILFMEDPSPRTITESLETARDKVGECRLENPLYSHIIVQDCIRQPCQSIRDIFDDAFSESLGWRFSPSRRLRSAFQFLGDEGRPRQKAFRLFVSYIAGDEAEGGAVLLHGGWYKCSSPSSGGSAGRQYLSDRSCSAPISPRKLQRLFLGLEPELKGLFRYLSQASDFRLGNTAGPLHHVYPAPA